MIKHRTATYPLVSSQAAGSLARAARIAAFVAFTAVGAQLAVRLPNTPVPVTMQTLFVVLAGIVLGPRDGFTAMISYIAIGAAGAPVFAGLTFGPAVLIGPTGGYLLGYLPAVFVIGWLAGVSPRRWWRDAMAMAVGAIIVYACGVTWLKFLTSMTFSKTLAVGMLPFLPGDALKIAAAVVIAKSLRPFIRISAVQRPAPETLPPKPMTTSP